MIIVGIDPSLSQTAMVVGGSPTSFKVSWHSSKKLGDTAHDRVTRYERLVAEIVAAIKAYPRPDSMAVR